MVMVSFEVTGQIIMSYTQVFVYVSTLVSVTKRFMGGKKCRFLYFKTYKNLLNNHWQKLSSSRVNLILIFGGY